MSSLIIYSRFLTQPITGVQRFAIEISKQLRKLDKNLKFIAPHDIIHKEIANELGVEIIGKLKGHLWDQIELPDYLRKHNYPLLLNLANTAPIRYRRKVVFR